MLEESSDKPQLLRAAIKLSKPSRWAAFILGVAGLGAGGVAAFIAHLEAPPVALLAVGLVLALVGLAGVLPTRLKVGDNEAEFLEQRLAVVLSESVEAAPTETAREQVAEVVDRVAAIAPAAAAPAQSAYEYDKTVLAMLRELARSARTFPKLWEFEDGLRDPGFDALGKVPASKENPRERHILVEIKSARRVVIGPIEGVKAKARSYARNHPEADTALVLVTRSRPESLAAVLASEDDGFYQVTVTERSDKHRLERAIMAAVTGAPICISS